MRAALVILLCLGIAACGEGGAEVDAGARRDAGTRRDGGPAILPDAGTATSAADASTVDAAELPDTSVAEDASAAEDATVGADATVSPDSAASDATSAASDAGSTSPDAGSAPACGDVRFDYDSSTAQSVLVTGSFAGWSTNLAQGAIALSNNGSGHWSGTTHLAPGRYEYKLVIDGSTWIQDPGNPNGSPDGFGGMNSVLDISCVGFQVLSHNTSGADFTADLRYGGSAGVGQVSLSLDHQAAPNGALSVSGSNLHLALRGLSPGVHDARLTDGAESILLKIYVNLSTDWRDAALYFVMTDRFVNGSPANDAPLGGMAPLNDYMGGDFLGITQKIQAGYFDDLGINALWISWPLDNTNVARSGSYQTYSGCNLSGSNTTQFAGYHGYWPSSGSNIESHFGTEAELEALIDAAHARGIRVLLDFTANHVAIDHPYFAAHPEWFNQPATLCRDGHWDDGLKTSCWFDSFLPDWNYTNAAARRAVLDDMVRVVQSTGADGLRVDALKHMEDAFISDLRARAHREFEQTGIDFYLVGETFTGDTGLIGRYVNAGMMYGQFDFPTNQLIGQGLAIDQIGLQSMHGSVRGAKASYGSAIGWMSTFIANHDIARFVSKAAGDLPCGWWSQGPDQSRAYSGPPAQPSGADPYLRLALAETYAFTVPGIPLLYYGDEVGLAGAGDPDNRRMLPLDNTLNANQQALRASIQRLGQARAHNAVLRTGDWTDALWADDTTLVFARTLGASKAIIAINRGEQRTIQVQVNGIGLSSGQVLRTQLATSPGSVTVSGNSVSLSLGRLGAEIWVSN